MLIDPQKVWSTLHEKAGGGRIKGQGYRAIMLSSIIRACVFKTKLETIMASIDGVNTIMFLALINKGKENDVSDIDSDRKAVLSRDYWNIWKCCMVTISVVALVFMTWHTGVTGVTEYLVSIIEFLKNFCGIRIFVLIRVKTLRKGSEGIFNRRGGCRRLQPQQLEKRAVCHCCRCSPMHDGRLRHQHRGGNALAPGPYAEPWQRAWQRRKQSVQRRAII